jgi:NADPH-dependent glutamate synthase beta subunit-like oxidoreductase/Pyruvate/2-oxoacid:ferredoxin oxidoreductase delta subunit
MSKTDIPLVVSASTITTEVNKTGFWRYVRPEFIERTAPCSAICPAGEDIPRIEHLVRQGLYQRALETILIENPFPSVCGRVCFHTCESVCNRRGIDEAINIRCIERFIGDQAITKGLLPACFRFPPNGKKIAVVGAGPAGLSAAWFLAMLGYACDVFESKSEAGGILRWGIPAYRLPADVLAYEIERIKSCGVRVVCNQSVAKDDFDRMKQAYDAVFVGCGNGRAVNMGIGGENHALDGLSFLCMVRSGKMIDIRGPAAVIGGGNTAADVSRTLVRLGVAPTMVYRRRRADMPAFPHEIDLAINEGVILKELLAPIRIEKAGDGYLLHVQPMRVSTGSAQGRTRVVPEKSDPVVLSVNHVIAAIGAEPVEPWHLPADNEQNAIALTHCRIVPGKIPVAFGGDLTNDVQSVADAVASGKQAAMALDLLIAEHVENVEEKLQRMRVGKGRSLSMEMYIGGQRKTRDAHEVGFEEINGDYFISGKRTVPEYFPFQKPGLPNSFSENEQSLNREAVMREVDRCFNCGICTDCDNCRLFCPEMAVALENSEPRHIRLDYCKGCGICVVECPRNAMGLREEQR